MAKNVLRKKYPFEYEVTSDNIEKGINWLTLRLKNISKETLRGLDIQLHSLDTGYLTVIGNGFYRKYLESEKEEMDLVFQINVLGSADVYLTIRTRKEDGAYFLWESGRTHISLDEEKAELERLVVLSHPYTTIGKTLSAEATVRGLRNGVDLKVAFWVETPSGKFVEQAKIDIKKLAEGEEARYTAEFTPNETGDYVIYAYLFDGSKRIGYKTDLIYAQKG
jgi:hypothetical protein